jgi:hypothetical protein
MQARRRDALNGFDAGFDHADSLFDIKRAPLSACQGVSRARRYGSVAQRGQCSKRAPEMLRRSMALAHSPWRNTRYSENAYLRLSTIEHACQWADDRSINPQEETTREKTIL